jgi:hypothetical protein
MDQTVVTTLCIPSGLVKDDLLLCEFVRTEGDGAVVSIYRVVDDLRVHREDLVW